MGRAGMSRTSDGVGFDVQGWPPKKSEAKSMFSAGHPQADRVHALLVAAQDAVRSDGWSPVIGPVALELTIFCPSRPEGDATNFLGGVADVLQTTIPPNVDVSHLGDMAAVGLYLDDKQISRISYREMPAVEVSYRVHVAAL